jgi:hypothetical protein
VGGKEEVGRGGVEEAEFLIAEIEGEGGEELIGSLVFKERLFRFEKLFNRFKFLQKLGIGMRRLEKGKEDLAGFFRFGVLCEFKGFGKGALGKGSEMEGISFCLEELFEVGKGEGVKGEFGAAREDGGEDFFRRACEENPVGVKLGLFERFEQSVCSGGLHPFDRFDEEDFRRGFKGGLKGEIDCFAERVDRVEAALPFRENEVEVNAIARFNAGKGCVEKMG